MPDLPGGAGEQRELLTRLRAVVGAKDAEVAMLRAELAAERELRRRMELRIAELERRLGQDSTDTKTGSLVGARQRILAWAMARVGDGVDCAAGMAGCRVGGGSGVRGSGLVSRGGH